MASNLRAALADLALHSTTTAPTDERQFLDDALGILARYQYDATIEVRRRPGYILSTKAPADAANQEPEGATTIEVDRQPVGWVAVRGADGEAARLLQLMIAGLARAALTAGDALREQARRQAILASVYTITSVATTAEAVELILETIYEETFRLLGVDTFIAGLYDEQRNEIYFPVRYDLGQRFPEVRIAYDPSSSISAWLIANRKPLLIRDRGKEQLPVATQSFGEERMVRSWLGVPMIAGGQVVGILAIQSYTAYAFDAGDQDLLNQIGQQAALAIMSQRGRAAYQRRLDELGALNELVRELSTPVIPIVEGILALPLIGTIDSHRATQITDHLLHEISRQQASVVLLDITGVPIVDTIVASYLIQAIKASQLLGAQCVLVGIRPEVAQTMVGLGMDLTGVTTLATLQEGVAYGLRMRGLEISLRQPRRSMHAPPAS